MIHFFNFVIHHNWCVFFFSSFLGLNNRICEDETSSNQGNAILSISKKYQKTEGVQQRRPTESEGMFDNLQPVSSNRFQIFCSHLGIVMNNSPKYFPLATTQHQICNAKAACCLFTEKQLRKNVIENADGPVLWRKLSRNYYFQAQSKNLKQTENFIRITRTSSAK